MLGNVREQPLASYKSYQRFLLGSIFSQGNTALWQYGILFLWGCPAVVLLVVFWVRYLRGVQRLARLAHRCPVAEDVLRRIQVSYSRP